MEFRFKGKREVAEGTMEFIFEAPPTFTFKAGQWCDFTILLPDGTPETRSLSIASSPAEGAVRVACRMRPSAFKEALKAMQPGTAVHVRGPMGAFTLPEDSARPVVFLAGGIGITPVRSIVAHAHEQGLPHRIYIFYSNRTAASTAYLDDFRQWQSDHCTFVPTLTDEAPPDWKHEQGRIDSAMLRRHITEEDCVYYLVGPPGMVQALRTLIRDHDPKGRLVTEDFAGY